MRWVKIAAAQFKLAAGLGAVALLVRLFGVQRATRIAFDVAERAPSRVAATLPFREAEQLTWRINCLAAVLPGHPRCLVRSLTIATILRRYGVPAVVQVGVRVDDGFAAHAWVEVNGQPTSSLEAGAARHVPLWEASE